MLPASADNSRFASSRAARYPCFAKTWTRLIATRLLTAWWPCCWGILRYYYVKTHKKEHTVAAAFVYL